MKFDETKLDGNIYLLDHMNFVHGGGYQPYMKYNYHDIYTLEEIKLIKPPHGFIMYVPLNYSTSNGVRLVYGIYQNGQMEFTLYEGKTDSYNVSKSPYIKIDQNIHNIMGSQLNFEKLKLAVEFSMI